MRIKLLVFDSHPVQYRVPIWRMMEQLRPGCVHVVYASDCSVRGHADAGFGKTFSWDDPLLEGYEYTVLNNEKGVPLSGWGSITGEGINKLIKLHQPAAVLLTGLNYRYDLEAYYAAIRNGVQLWLRCENQDQAFDRSKLKGFVRDIIYRVEYLGINKFFFIGQLNKDHYKNHGVSESQLRPAYYATVNRFQNVSNKEKAERRNTIRASNGIGDSAMVVGFAGKFIDKKNPLILFQMIEHIPAALRERIFLYFIGSGPLENELRSAAKYADENFGVKTIFTGFLNQSQLPDHYLALDTLVLPSRRMGETWGLVVNEAMQAGSSVIVSDAVGSSADFKSIQRFKIFQGSAPSLLAAQVVDLSKFSHDFDWADNILKTYSLDVTARALIDELDKVIA